MSSQTSSSSWALPAAPTHPKSTDAAFIGHTFKWAAHSWQIHQKTANKRGPVSWVWHHGSELWEAKGPIEKGTLAVPSMLGPRCEEGTKLGIPETRKRLDWAMIEASEVSRGLMKVWSVVGRRRAP
jgi:hypothetical protein